MDEFYVVLPSNTPGSGNTTSQFTVRIPHTLELDANWTVALASIIYPYSFSSVGIDDDDLITITLVNPNFKFPDDKRFVSIQIKVPSLQFSNVEHLRQTLNSLIKEQYNTFFAQPGDNWEEQSGGLKQKRQVDNSAAFFHDNPVDYWEKIGEKRNKNAQLEQEIQQNEQELSTPLTDLGRKKELESELPLKRLRYRRKKDEIEELERAAKRRDEETPENEQRKIQEFFQHHPEDYNKKLNEARLVFTKYLSGLQDRMSKYVGEKDANKIRQLNTEMEGLREKLKYLRYNLNIFENAALMRVHQKSLNEYERVCYEQNNAYVDEFFEKHPSNYWQIIHNNYEGLREQFEKISDLQKRAHDLKEDRSFQHQIEKAKQLIEYRRKRFAALEYEAKKRDERLPIPSALTAGEALKERLSAGDSGVPTRADRKKVDVLDTNATPATRGETLRQKILQTKGIDDKPIAEKIDDSGALSHGKALIEGLRLSQLHHQKGANIEVKHTFAAGAEEKLTHGEQLGRLLLFKAGENSPEEAEEVSRPGGSLTRGRILKELLHNMAEEPDDDDGDGDVGEQYQQNQSSRFIGTRGEAMKTLIKKAQEAGPNQSVAKTRGETLKLMLEHQKFSRIDEASFSKLVAAQQKEKTAAELKFSNITQRFVLETSVGVLHMDVSKHLAYVLVFENTRLYHGEQASYMPDLSGGVKQLYVYAPKLIEECIIGDRMAPLLRVVNVSATHGGTDVPEVIYTNEIFHSLQNKRISEIQIEIQNAFGRYVKFNWGTCILTLHFRRKLF